MLLRAYTPDDAEALVAIYRDAVLKLGPQAYSDEQVRVWARAAEDVHAFGKRLSEGLTLCAEVDGALAAFGQLHPADHIALLFCHSFHARKGYASQILGALEEYAASRCRPPCKLHVEASCVARPFFARHGYKVVEEERTVRDGLEFLRFRMVKQITQAQ